MCTKAQNTLASGCAMSVVSTVSKPSFDLLFHYLSPDVLNTCNYITCSVTKLFLLIQLRDFWPNHDFGNFTLWKFPRVITWFLGKQTTKPLKNGSRQIVLLWFCFACLAELTDKDWKDEVRTCHGLCDLFKTKIFYYHCIALLSQMFQDWFLKYFCFS